MKGDYAVRTFAPYNDDVAEAWLNRLLSKGYTLLTVLTHLHTMTYIMFRQPTGMEAEN